MIRLWRGAEPDVLPEIRRTERERFEPSTQREDLIARSSARATRR